MNKASQVIRQKTRRNLDRPVEHIAIRVARKIQFPELGIYITPNHAWYQLFPKSDISSKLSINSSPEPIVPSGSVTVIAREKAGVADPVWLSSIAGYFDIVASCFRYCSSYGIASIIIQSIW